MKHTYSITGMTCNGCVASVTEKLSEVSGVTHVAVDLVRGTAQISMKEHLPLDSFKSVLPEKYSIMKKGSQIDVLLQDSEDFPLRGNENLQEKESKLKQLKPLLLIFLYLFAASFLLNFQDWNSEEAMLDFMGLFYIVFSFFKLLDLKGFPESFRMYDPLAKMLPVYGWVYPFIELALGLMFLMRFQVTIALIVTLVVLGITTFGVTKTLIDKKSIRCACLGTALKLPMTEATFIENTIMLVMAIALLVNG